MDPNATVNQILAYLAMREWGAANDLLVDLADWARSGGLAPSDANLDALTMALHRAAARNHMQTAKRIDIVLHKYGKGIL